MHAPQASQATVSSLDKEEEVPNQQNPQDDQATACQLKRNLTSIDRLTACGTTLLTAVRFAYEKLLVVSWLVRQQNLLDQSGSRSVPERIVSLSQAHVKPIVHGKPSCAVEFGAKTTSVRDENCKILHQLNLEGYNKGDELKA